PYDARGGRRLGAGLQALRRGHRPELSRGGGRVGALVGAERRRPPRVPGRDRQALLHATQPVASPRHAAFPAQASGAPVRIAVTAKTDKYGPQAARWSEEAYADANAYLAHRAALIVSLGPRLARGATVLGCARADGG